MQQSLLFSVLIANFNNGHFIEQAIRSVLQQTWQQFEIIIVDDASTDNSVSIIQRLQLDDPRINLIRNTRNQGVGYTKRCCIENSKGELLGFLDSDDSLSFDALEIMVSAHCRNPEASLIYSTHYICDSFLCVKGIFQKAEQIPIEKTYLHINSKDNTHITHFATFKRFNYEQTSGLSVKFKKAIDKDLYFKLEETGRIIFINAPLYYYRHHEGSISLNENRLKAFYWELIAKKDAYQRRKSISRVHNIKKVELLNEWGLYYELSIANSIAEKHIFSSLYLCVLFLLQQPSILTIKKIYYQFKRNLKPQAY